MANLQVDFPGPAQLRQLISSFPLKWQGLFAALNVPVSQAIPLGDEMASRKIVLFARRTHSTSELCRHYGIPLTKIMATPLAESDTTFGTSVPKSAANSNIVVITDLARQSNMKSNSVSCNRHVDECHGISTEAKPPLTGTR